jgi:DNA-binding IclR family transcriptional regulator
MAADVSDGRDDHRTELLTLLRGAPSMPIGSLARELGDTEAEVHGLIKELLEKGKLVQEEGRLIVVEPAAAPYDDDEELPV